MAGLATADRVDDVIPARISRLGDALCRRINPDLTPDEQLALVLEATTAAEDVGEPVTEFLALLGNLVERGVCRYEPATVELVVVAPDGRDTNRRFRVCAPEREVET